MNSLILTGSSSIIKRASILRMMSAKAGGTGKSKKQTVTVTKGSEDLMSKDYDPPANVFRKVNEEELGPGASKRADSLYKNPEYFSYHDQSYNEMEVVMMNMRCPQPKSGSGRP